MSTERITGYEMYVEPHLDEIEDLVAAGYTDYQIADLCGVASNSFVKYKAKHKALVEAIARGRRRGVTAVVSAIFKRAQGYEVQERSRKLIRDPNTQQALRLEDNQTTKHVPPDLKAAEIWLSKVDAMQWGAKKHSGSRAQELISELYDKREANEWSALKTGREFEKVGLEIPETLRMEMRAELESQGVELTANPQLQVFLPDGSQVNLAEVDAAS